MQRFLRVGLPLFLLTVVAATPVMAVAEAETQAAEEKPGLLSPDFGSAVWTIVLFVVLLVILGKFVWPPILKGLQNRENKIRGDLEHAEQAAKQAEQTLKEYQKSLAQAQEDARKIIEKGRVDAEHLASQLKDQTQAEINQARVRAQSEIRAAKEQALAEVYAQTATLATDVAGRILRREITPADHQKLVQESLNEMNRPGRN